MGYHHHCVAVIPHLGHVFIRFHPFYPLTNLPRVSDFTACYNPSLDPFSMAKTIVALDLETTGLEADRDAIIEIGAIRFKGDRVEAEFSTLVNPGRKLSPFITRLTGITDAMLVNAPRLPAL